MRTRAAALAVVLGLVVTGEGPRPAHGQVEIDAATAVRSIRFSGVDELNERDLRAVLRTRDRGSAYGLRAFLGRLPLVSDPAVHPFDPFELQRDVVRLRRHYRLAGFVDTRVDYDVRRDDAENLLDVTFVVTEGRPLLVTGVEMAGADSVARLVPPGEEASWRKVERSLAAMAGRRLDVSDARERIGRAGTWWRERGHPVAVVRPDVVMDTVRAEARIAFRVVPGPRGRFGSVRLEGNDAVADEALLRQVPIEEGDVYSSKALTQARTNLQELAIVRVADVGVPGLEGPDSAATARVAADSVTRSGEIWDLPVRIRVTEAKPRLVSGEVGYVTDGGLSSEAHWEHDNVTGDARTLAFTGLAQTGWLSLADDPDVRYRLSASFQQPGFVLPRGWGVLSPFVEYRDDTQDRSTQVGMNATFIYRFLFRRSISLDYQIARRYIDEYRFGDLASGDIDLLTFLTQVSQGRLDSLGSTLESSTLTLSGTAGSLDDPANPRRGWVLRPSIQTTAPNAWSSTSYWRLEATANGFVPLGRRAVIAARVSAGRLLPVGKSLPDPGENPTVSFLQLRDATFTAGGTTDVRGWENRRLGPKVPDIRFEESGDSLARDIDGYVPLGGFSRASFSVELQLPLPGVGSRMGAHVFLDGGRVWTDDGRFGLEGDPNGQEKLFFATGAGLDVRTPVGPIKLGVGYKLNPSITDLVEASDLVRFAEEGRPISEAPQKNSRRWQWHLAIGASY